MNVGKIFGQLKDVELKMQEIKTNCKRKNARSIFLILKPK
jgi:hypothetical protein